VSEAEVWWGGTEKTHGERERQPKIIKVEID
jgi:hypothetical protein